MSVVVLVSLDQFGLRLLESRKGLVTVSPKFDSFVCLLGRMNVLDRLPSLGVCIFEIWVSNVIALSHRCHKNRQCSEEDKFLHDDPLAESNAVDELRRAEVRARVE